MNKAKVLFICTGNSARSQMAEGFLEEYGSEQFAAYSGGLKAEGIHPYTKEVMAEVGIDISNQESKKLKTFLGQMHFGYLITVCKKAANSCPTFPDVSKRLNWELDDPKKFKGTEEEQLTKFREVRDKIKTKVQKFITDNSK